MPIQHKKTIDAIIDCRSGQYGIAVYQCDRCGKKHHIDRSCGNRHCPQCQYHKSRQWLEAQLNRRLPGDHFLLTFTVPEQLRLFCRSHQEAAYGAMFDASAGAIKKLANNPRSKPSPRCSRQNSRPKWHGSGCSTKSTRRAGKLPGTSTVRL